MAGKRLCPVAAWTQGADARDARGEPLWWREGVQHLPGAVAWSLGFAIQDGLPLELPFNDVVSAVARGIGVSDRNFYGACAAIRRWNDDAARRHDDVLNALRRAYRLALTAEQEPQP